MIDVASNGKEELYHLLTINGRPTTKPVNSLSGFKSNGEFDSLQRFVFQPASHAKFTWERWTRLRGRLVHVFGYFIEQKRSEYRLDFHSRTKRYRETTAARGFVYLDADTHKCFASAEAVGIPGSGQSCARPRCWTMISRKSPARSIPAASFKSPHYPEGRRAAQPHRTRQLPAFLRRGHHQFREIASCADAHEQSAG